MSARFIPLNPQDHDNYIRSIAISHMGLGQGNPSTWVIQAMHEVHQRAFSMGFDAGFKAANTPSAAQAYKVAIDPPAAPAPAPRQPRMLPGAGDITDA